MTINKDKYKNHKASNKMVVLLYLLLRDELPAGAIEKHVKDVEDEWEHNILCNGYLAEYAEDIVKRLSSDN